MSELSDLITAAAGGDATATAKITAMETAAGGVGELEKRLVTMTTDRDKAVAAKQAGRLSGEERAKLTDLEQKADKAEEDRLKAAGDYDALTKRSDDKLKVETDRAAGLQTDLDNGTIDAAFSRASDLFGPEGLTILTPELAIPVLRRHCKLVPGENGTPSRVVVNDQKGEPFTKDGDTATFAEGMRQLIEGLPNKADILRAGGKTGSGSQGEHQSTATLGTVSRSQMILKAQGGDAEAKKLLGQNPVQGAEIPGRRFARRDAEAAQKTA